MGDSSESECARFRRCNLHPGRATRPAGTELCRPQTRGGQLSTSDGGGVYLTVLLYQVTMMRGVFLSHTKMPPKLKLPISTVIQSYSTRVTRGGGGDTVTAAAKTTMSFCGVAYVKRRTTHRCRSWSQYSVICDAVAVAPLPHAARHTKLLSRTFPSATRHLVLVPKPKRGGNLLRARGDQTPQARARFTTIALSSLQKHPCP